MIENGPLRFTNLSRFLMELKSARSSSTFICFKLHVIFRFNCGIVVASQPPSYTLALRRPQKFSIGRQWGMLGGLH